MSQERGEVDHEFRDVNLLVPGSVWRQRKEDTTLGNLKGPTLVHPLPGLPGSRVRVTRSGLEPSTIISITLGSQ